jgi:pimeloyl-ACP methyl ester carboxylesterase
VENLRRYGCEPFNIAVIHGGPGAAGEMAPVARNLAAMAAFHGILEPLQTKTSLVAQVKELKYILEKNGNLPMILIGFSWGAWLSFILTAQNPGVVKKLILISAGSFIGEYAGKVQETRLGRLNPGEKKMIEFLDGVLHDPLKKDKNPALAQLGALFAKIDAYDPIEYEPEIIESRFDIFQGVWNDAAELRKNGQLLELGRAIKCPVTAIHGDYDPHPAEGVKKPLMGILKRFRFILLKNCGHTPWIERQAREKFYEILNDELL